MGEPVKRSEFPGRRPGTVPAGEPIIRDNQPEPQPTPERPGNFNRNPCGGCVHFKPNPRAGLDAGFCMWGPPVAHPVRGPQGQAIGNVLARPVLTANTEGCDQWDDESDFEGDGIPGEAGAIAAEG